MTKSGSRHIKRFTRPAIKSKLRYIARHIDSDAERHFGPIKKILDLFYLVVAIFV